MEHTVFNFIAGTDGRRLAYGNAQEADHIALRTIEQLLMEHTLFDFIVGTDRRRLAHGDAEGADHIALRTDGIYERMI